MRLIPQAVFENQTHFNAAIGGIQSKFRKGMSRALGSSRPLRSLFYPLGEVFLSKARLLLVPRAHRGHGAAPILSPVP